MIKAGKLKHIAPKKEAMSPDTLPARLAALARLPDEAVQHAVAKNPHTPPKALKKLGSSRDKYIRKAVAGNPNTPADIMSGLGGQFPMELLGNPALDLLLLENPDLFSEMPIGTLRSLAKRENCPEGLLVYMAREHHQDENLQRSLVQNPNTPRKVIEQIVESHTREDIKEEARMHISHSSELDAEYAETLFWETIANQVNCSTPLHWQLLSDTKAPAWVHVSLVARQVLWGDKGSDVLAIQENPLPIPVLESLAANGRIKIRRAACFNSASPEWLREARFKNQVIKGIQAHTEGSLAKLSELYGNGPPEYDILLGGHPLATAEMKSQWHLPELGDQQMREKTASHPFAWAELLWELAESADEHSGMSIRRAVAKNPNTPVTLLEKLAMDKEEEVRFQVANNPATPSTLLDRLAEDGDRNVRGVVAKNTNTHVATLKMLSEDANDEVRRALALNPNTPAEVLEKLAGEKNLWRNIWSRIEIMENPNISSSVFEQLIKNIGERDYDIVNRRCARAAAREGWLRKIAGSSEPYYRQVASENRNTPVVTLEKLAGDDDSEVRRNIAYNPNTPASALEKLAGDINMEIRWRVAKNPNTPVWILEKLAGDKDRVVRWSVAENPNTPASVLEKLAGDDNSTVRSDVAGNPNTPSLILEMLAGDIDNGVRWRVAENHNTPTSALERFSGDSVSGIRRYVADHLNAPASALEKLAKDKCEDVRWDVASNPNTTLSTLEILACDTETRVRKTARDTLRRRKSIVSTSTQ